MKKKHVSVPSFRHTTWIIIGACFLLVYLAWPDKDKAVIENISHVRHDVVLHFPRGDVYAQLAQTPSERELGLSFRPEIGDDEAMLFVFDTPDKYGFWMKDMNFPIDMVWLSPSGRVVYMEENVATSTYPKAFINDSPAQFVLELHADASREYGIYLGTKVDINTIKK